MTAPEGIGVYDGVFLDLDGTLYRGSRGITGACEAVEGLRERGTAVRFVTNNAAKTAADVTDRLTAFGFTAEASEVHTSSQAAGSVLADKLPAGARVLVVGAEALIAQVRAAGLSPVREFGGGVDAVVQGHDPDTGWRLLAEACVAIRAGALWLACNSDATLPSERGELPGNGAMVAALRTATAVEPEVAGKPRPPLLRLAARESGCRQPLVVGDRLETDIAGADAAGMDALLVLSGVTTPARVLEARPGERPRYIAEDVTCLSGSLAHAEVGPRHGADSAWRVSQDGTSLAVSSLREGSGISLLRQLCALAWESGATTVRGEDDGARAALAELDLAG